MLLHLNTVQLTVTPGIKHITHRHYHGCIILCNAVHTSALSDTISCCLRSLVLRADSRFILRLQACIQALGQWLARMTASQCASLWCHNLAACDTIAMRTLQPNVDDLPFFCLHCPIAPLNWRSAFTERVAAAFLQQRTCEMAACWDRARVTNA